MSQYVKEFIELSLDEESRYKKEKGKKYDYAKILREYSGNEWAFVNYGSINKLGINPGQSYSTTPMGIYGYPLEIYNAEQILAGKVPFRGTAKYIHIFIVKSDYRNKIVVIDKSKLSSSGQEALNVDIDFEKRSKDYIEQQDNPERILKKYKRKRDNIIEQFEELRKKALLEKENTSCFKKLNNMSPSDENEKNVLLQACQQLEPLYQQVVDLLEILYEDFLMEEQKAFKERNWYRVSAKNYISKMKNNLVISRDFKNNYFELVKLYQEYILDLNNEIEMKEDLNQVYKDSKVDDPFVRYWKITRNMNKSITKWSKTLMNDGIYGVLDLGTGTVHPAEPAQIVVFSAKVIEHIATIPNPAFSEEDDM